MNKLNNTAIKTMNARTKTGVLIVIYCTIAFCFLFFGDNHGWNKWINFKYDNILRLCLSLLFVSTFSWFSFLISKELDNCFLKTNKKSTQLVIAFTLFFGQLVPTIIMLLNYYAITNIDPIISMYIYLAISVGAAATALIICLVLTSKYRNTKGLSLFFLPFVLIGLIWSFEYFYYLGIVRGWTSLLVIITGVFTCDVFAYFGGMLFGKHKFSPKISPKKSWEGVIIGCLFSIGFIFLLLFLLNYSKHDTSLLFFGYGFLEKNNWLWWISVSVISVAIAILTVLGDLLFSWFKRINNIKDFGSLLPGHGGILDRLDSLLTVSAIIGALIGMISFIFVFINNNPNIFFPTIG